MEEIQLCQILLDKILAVFYYSFPMDNVKFLAFATLYFFGNDSFMDFSWCSPPSLRILINSKWPGNSYRIHYTEEAVFIQYVKSSVIDDYEDLYKVHQKAIWIIFLKVLNVELE